MGLRQALPVDCPAPIADMQVQCFSLARPRFGELCERLQILVRDGLRKGQTTFAVDEWHLEDSVAIDAGNITDSSKDARYAAIAVAANAAAAVEEEKRQAKILEEGEAGQDRVDGDPPSSRDIYEDNISPAVPRVGGGVGGSGNNYDMEAATARTAEDGSVYAAEDMRMHDSSRTELLANESVV